MSSKYNRLRTKSAFILKNISCHSFNLHRLYHLYFGKFYPIYHHKNQLKKLCLEGSIWRKEKSFSRRETCLLLDTRHKNRIRKNFLNVSWKHVLVFVGIGNWVQRTLAIVLLIVISNEPSIIYIREDMLQI